MSAPDITGLYAGLLALLFLWLSARVILHRRGHRISLGDGGDPQFRSLIRAHGNWAEYAPLALVLMALLELGGGPAWGLHVLGLMLLGGRLAHAAALTRPGLNLAARTLGMSLTLLVIGAAALWLLLRGLAG